MSHGLVASDNSLGPSDHTFGLPDHGLEPQGRYWSHGPRLFRVLANVHYKYVRQDRERYRMPMNVHFMLARLSMRICNEHSLLVLNQSTVRNRGGWNIMRGAAPRIRALGRTLHAKMFSIQILLHFSQIVPRVCTLVLFIFNL